MRANHRDPALAPVTSMRLCGEEAYLPDLGCGDGGSIRTSLAVRAEIRSFTTVLHEPRRTFGAPQPYPVLAEGLCSRVAARSQPARTVELNGGHCRAARLLAAHHSHSGQIVAERFAADPSTVVSVTTFQDRASAPNL